MAKRELLWKCCWMPWAACLGGGPLNTAVLTAAAAATQAALWSTVGILGTQGCLSWWGLRGWLPRGLGQKPGRGTPVGAALGIRVRRQVDPRLPAGLWLKRKGVGNGGLELKVPCCLPGGGDIRPTPSRLWCLAGGTIPGLRALWRSAAPGGIMGWLGGELALVRLHLEVT